MTLRSFEANRARHSRYYGKDKHLPPRCFTDSEGKPLLSWRVAILPYVEQAAMYNAMRLDEAWNSQHNLTFVLDADSQRMAKIRVKPTRQRFVPSLSGFAMGR